MPLDNLKNRFCPCCSRRGDKIGTKNLREVSDEKQAKDFIENDIICNKHYIKFNKEYNKRKHNPVSSSENNVAEINDLVYENSFEINSSNQSNVENLESRVTFYAFNDEIHYSNTELNLRSTNSQSIKQNNYFKTTLNIQRGYATHGKCFIYECKSKSRPLMVLPIQSIVDIYIQVKILIPIGARVCSSHLNENNFIKDEFINEIPIVNDSINLSNENVEKLFKSFRSYQEKRLSIFNQFYEFSLLSSDQCLKVTGFTKDELFFIENELKSLINSETRSKLQALAIYLFWLKTGLIQNMIADNFSIHNRQMVSNFCSQVRNAMLKDFVPNYLGAKRLTREEWLNQNTGMVNKLFDLNENQLVIVADGIYCYCQKSSNNSVQRKLYCSYKKRHLVKPFVITSANGKIIDVYGPCFATDDDGTIFLNILEKDDDLRSLLAKEDLAILDRGFRKVISKLKSKYHLNPKMPTCLTNNQKQLSCSEANQTRLVTKCRYVVEVVNGIFKQQFKALEHIQNKMITHIIDDYRIAACLINCFFSDYISDKNDWEEIAESMKNKLNVKNNLESYIDIRISQYSFTKIENYQDQGFPKLNLDQIQKYITFGNYQLEQAFGYLADHFNKHGDIEFFTCNKMFDENEKKIIFTKIQSRHCNSEKYKVFIMFSPNSENISDISWICSRKMGKRTMGCCSHIASIIYFMGIGRFDPKNIPKPGYTIKRFLIQSRNESDYEIDSENKETDLNSINSSIKRSLSFASESQNDTNPYKK